MAGEQETEVRADDFRIARQRYSAVLGATSEVEMSTSLRLDRLVFREKTSVQHGPRHIGQGTFAGNLEDCGTGSEKSRFVKVRSRHYSTSTATRKTIESGIPENCPFELSFWTKQSKIGILGDGEDFGDICRHNRLKAK